MLIVLPPSESKQRAPAGARPLALDDLSFRELTDARFRMIDALIETSRRPDAPQRLRVGPTLVGEVARNVELLSEPTGRAVEIYSGPLYDGLDWASLPNKARKRADESVVIASALWGLLRPSDRIPAYRLHICSNLPGIERIDATWRALVSDTLTQAAGERGVILDLRSPMYQATGKPHGLADRTITVRVGPPASQGGVGDVVAKRVRGQAARFLLESGADPDDPELLAVILGEHWPVGLDDPLRPGQPWTLSIRPQH